MLNLLTQLLVSELSLVISMRICTRLSVRFDLLKTNYINKFVQLNVIVRKTVRRSRKFLLPGMRTSSLLKEEESMSLFPGRTADG